MQYPAYIPEKKKGFFLDPRTKLLFMVLIATLMFVVYNNIPYICVLAGLPFLLLIINGQKKTAVIYGGLFVLAVIANDIKDAVILPQLLNGKTILIAEHRLYYLMDVVDRIIILQDGQIEKDIDAASFGGG